MKRRGQMTVSGASVRLLARLSYGQAVISEGEGAVIGGAMTTMVVTETVKLVVDTGWCGHHVALAASRWEYFRNTGETFWCPYGHPTVFKDPENARLKKALTEAQEIANSARLRETTALKMLDVERAAQNRLLRRVQAGVCPHCHRTFQQLARHMLSKHQQEE